MKIFMNNTNDNVGCATLEFTQPVPDYVPTTQPCSMYNKLYEKLGYTFKDETILKKALSQTEHSRWRLVGDAMLAWVVYEELAKRHPDGTVEQLNKARAYLVNHLRLSKYDKDLEFNKYIKLTPGFNGQMKNILADTFEALAYAIKLDGGLEQAISFITRVMDKHLSLPLDQLEIVNHVQLLERYAAKVFSVLPIYQTKQNNHLRPEPSFHSSVYHGSELLGVGNGRTKKEAEQEAARKALVKLGQTANF